MSADPQQGYAPGDFAAVPNSNEELSEDKLLQLQQLLSSVKKKTLDLRSHIEFFKNLNIKLEAFIKAMEAYSEPAQEEGTGPAAKEATAKKPLPQREDRKAEKRMKREEERCVDIQSRISTLFMEHRANRATAMDIYLLLDKNGTTCLDEIVKQIKQSKYRVINVLNAMVKDQIILKHFEKGFNYTLNRE